MKLVESVMATFLIYIYNITGNILYNVMCLNFRIPEIINFPFGTNDLGPVV